MKAFREFQATRRYVADLRTIEDSAYGANNCEPDSYPEPVAGYAYADSLTIQELPNGEGFRTFIQFEEDSKDLLSQELELFFWYVGAAERLTLFDAMWLACHQSDLDRACRYVQETLGVESGDNAALFFSGPEGDNWSTCPPIERADILARYVRSELPTVDYRLETEQPLA